MNPIPAIVLVIEAHPMMREALCTAIQEEPDMKAGMQARNVSQALWMAITVLPDIILLALDDPRHGDLDSLMVLHNSLPKTPILALISNEVPGQEQAALEYGAQAVLTKAAPRAELLRILRELHVGHTSHISRAQTTRNHSESYFGEAANEQISP
jgi:DNA-binding NarL/FixJ family response regulator